MQYGFEDLEVDVERRVVLKAGAPVQLPDLTFDLLVFLLKTSPKTSSPKEMAEPVWSMAHVADETVAQRIALLRKALADDPKDPDYIRTIRGAGYALCGKAEVIMAHTPTQHNKINPKVTMAMITGLVVLLAVLVMPMLPLSQSFSDRQVEVGISTTLKHPSETDILLNRAETLLSLHQAKETNRAIDMLRDVLQEDPENLRALQSLSFALANRSAKIQNSPSDEEEAEALARKALELDVSSTVSWQALALTLDAQGRTEESLAAYEQAYTLDPSNASALSSAAYLHGIRGHLFKSLELEVRSANTGTASRYSDIQIAQILDLVGDPRADDWYERSARLAPGQPVVVSELATRAIRNGQFEDSLKHIQIITGDDSQNARLIKIKGRALILLARKDEAQAIWQASPTGAGGNLPALMALEGKELQARNELAKLKQIILQGSSWPGLRVSVAELHASLGEYDQVTQYLSQAIDLGWRDKGLLINSPFLQKFMSTYEGLQLLERIDREIDAQTILLTNADEIQTYLNLSTQH